MKPRYLLCIAAFSMLLLSSCDMLGNKSDALVKVAENIKSANNNGIDANNNTGISSGAITMSGRVETNVKVLEKYDSPMVQVKKFVVFEGSSSNSKIKREYKKMNAEGQLLEQETEIIEPVKAAVSKDKSVSIWVLLVILLNVIILGVVIKKKSS